MKLDDVDGDDFAIDDRRGRGSSGGLGGISLGRGAKGGIGALVLAVVAILISQAGGGGGGGFDLEDALGALAGEPAVEQSAPTGVDDGRDAQEQFVGQVGSLLQRYWSEAFAASGEPFREASVVVFDQPTDTGGCGVGQPEAGPFYCPASEQIFIDFGFYGRLEDQLGFGGDFAMAYVLAHEYGHHIQTLLGVDDELQRAQADATSAEANALSVDFELQADCLAGVWAHAAYQDRRLEAGDLDEALGAAAAVGDDAVSGGRTPRESFTHGSSAERREWFTTGFESGDASRCDTFA
ncbi:MAG: neutral zinc metallopeptidase [Acidimicrobiales bacterium]|nr:neutral zinc metallopeptidase [Acidimicrobiales bacterium]